MSYKDELYAKNAYEIAINTMHQANKTETKAENVATVADEANAQALFTALMTDTLLEEEEE